MSNSQTVQNTLFTQSEKPSGTEHRKHNPTSQQNRRPKKKQKYPPENKVKTPDLNMSTDVAEMHEGRREENSGPPIYLSIAEMYKMKSSELKEFAAKVGVKNSANRNSIKQHIILNIIKKYYETHKGNVIIYCSGVVELQSNNSFGFIRNPYNDYKISPEDVYVNNVLIKQHNLKTGDTVEGEARAPRPKEKHLALLSIQKINLYPISKKADPIVLENEITEHPNERIIFETTPNEYCGRMLDLICPFGLGQRAIISAPPRAGKTAIMKTIAQAVRKNRPDIKLMVLLIDERPEEVTDMKQSLPGAEVVASTFDEDPESQIHLAEMVYNKAKRLAEHGHNIFLIIDSIGRLTRNFNQMQSNTGRSLSGGIDANALYKTKKFIGLARNIKDGGSISIIGSCLINTNSKLDEVVHEEFKGRGNCDIYLSSPLANRRIFPAIEIEKSGTRKEEVLLHADEMAKHIKLRRELAGYGSIEQTSLLLSRLKDTKSNIELLMSI